MSKLTLTLVSAAAIGLAIPTLISARDNVMPRRSLKGNQTAESVMQRYPLLGRTIASEQSNTLLPISRRASMPERRLNAPQSRAAAPVHMLGNVVYADNWDSRYSGYGLYEINAGAEIETALKLKGTKTEPYSNGGGVLVDDKFFSTYWYEGWGMVLLDLSVYDVKNWEKIGTYYLEPDEGEMDISPLTWPIIPRATQSTDASITIQARATNSPH